ncbi:MAG: PQQ-like beta-propeller repeat protein [Pirellulales bacterium]
MGTGADSAAAALRMRFPLIVVALYWAAYVIVGLSPLHMFYTFLARLGLAFAAGLAVLVWWFRARRFSIKARFGVVGLVLLGGVVTTFLLHHTVMAPIAYQWSLPLVMTLGTLWLAAVRNVSPSLQLAGLAAAIGLAWLPGPLVRMEGLMGDGSNDVYWRWSQSSEERFVAELPKASSPAELGDAPLKLTAGDWPQFRGPTGDSRAPGLKIATNWTQAPPKLVWKHAIGPAWSSVIVVGDRIFTQEQRLEIEAVTCYSAADGKQLWSHELKDRFEEALGGVGPRATPAFADGRIYAFSPRGRLDCLEARDGKLVWSVDAFQENEGKLPMWGYSISPVVADGKVVVFTGGEKNLALVAYDALTGKRAWTVPAGFESYASPVVVTLHGKPQVLFLGDGKLVSVEPATGKVLWEFASPEVKTPPAAAVGEPAPPVTSPQGRPAVQPQLVGDNRLLLSFVPENLLQIEISKQGDSWSAREIWKSREIRPDYSDFVVYDGHIYGFDAVIFCCVELATGKRKWKKGRYGAGQALLLPDVPAVLVVSEEGELILLACNSEKHEELARFPAIEGKTWNHLALSRGKLYVRNAQEIACYELPVAADTALANR